MTVILAGKWAVPIVFKQESRRAYGTADSSDPLAIDLGPSNALSNITSSQNH